MSGPGRGVGWLSTDPAHKVMRTAWQDKELGSIGGPVAEQVVERGVAGGGEGHGRWWRGAWKVVERGMEGGLGACGRWFRGVWQVV